MYNWKKYFHSWAQIFISAIKSHLLDPGQGPTFKTRLHVFYNKLSWLLSAKVLLLVFELLHILYCDISWYLATMYNNKERFNLVYRAHTSWLSVIDLLLRQGVFQLLRQGAFQLLNHDHTVSLIAHARDIRVYNINTVDPNENFE